MKEPLKRRHKENLEKKTKWKIRGLLSFASHIFSACTILVCLSTSPQPVSFIIILPTFPLTLSRFISSHPFLLWWLTLFNCTRVCAPLLFCFSSYDLHRAASQWATHIHRFIFFIRFHFSHPSFPHLFWPTLSERDRNREEEHDRNRRKYRRREKTRKKRKTKAKETNPTPLS